MKQFRIILFVVCAALFASPAPAQSLKDIPSLVLNKKSEYLPKDVFNFAWLTHKDSKTEWYRFVTDANDPVSVPLDGDNRIDTFFANTMTEHAKYAWARPALGASKESKVRNDGGQNKSRSVFEGVGFFELDIYPYGDRQSGFGGDLNVGRAQAGGNGIILRAEVRKVDQVELGPIQIGSQARRDALNDVIPVIIRKYPSEMVKYVELRRNDWFCDDPRVNEFCDMAIAKGLSTTQIMAAMQSKQQSSQQGRFCSDCGGPLGANPQQHRCQGGGDQDYDQGQGDFRRDNQSTKRTSRSQVDDEDLDTAPVVFTIEGETLKSQGRVKNGQRLLAKSTDVFDVEIIRIYPDGKEVSLTKGNKSLAGLRNYGITLDLATGAKYLVMATRSGQPAGMFLFEVSK